MKNISAIHIFYIYEDIIVLTDIKVIIFKKYQIYTLYNIAVYSSYRVNY